MVFDQVTSLVDCGEAVDIINIPWFLQSILQIPLEIVFSKLVKWGLKYFRV